MNAEDARQLAAKALPPRERLKWIREEINCRIEITAACGAGSVKFATANFTSSSADIHALIKWLQDDGFEVDWYVTHPVLFGTIEIFWDRTQA